MTVTSCERNGMIQRTNLKQRKTVSELKFTYKYIISTDLTNSWKIEKPCTMAVIGQGHGLNRYWVV